MNRRGADVAVAFAASCLGLFTGWGFCWMVAGELTPASILGPLAAVSAVFWWNVRR